MQLTKISVLDQDLFKSFFFALGDRNGSAFYYNFWREKNIKNGDLKKKYQSPPFLSSVGSGSVFFIDSDPICDAKMRIRNTVSLFLRSFAGSGGKCG